MEELGFFNEREAECFEREDTLSLSDLEKLNVSEDLADMERAEQLLKTGLDKQRISVLTSLPTILASNNSKSNLVLILDCMKVAWQKCEADITNSGAVLLEIFKGVASLACATVDGKVLSYPVVTFHEAFVQQMEASRAEKKRAVFLVSDEHVAKLLVPLALDMVADIQQKDYAEAASMAVIAALLRLGSTLKKTQILRVAIEKGDVSQPPGARLICCLLLGAVTAQNMLSSQDIEGLFFQKMMALCQDTDAEVRKCMCIQLDALARAVGEEKASSELLPELLELLQDEEEQVKQTAFLALLSLLDFFPAAERIKRVVPEFVCMVDTQPDYLVTILAEQYGVLVTKLAALNHLGSDTAPTFLQSYARLCSRDDVDIRQFCAYNFPAIVKAFGSSCMLVLMDDLLVKLCNDAVEKVRYHAAAGVHEIVVLLGQQRAQRYIKPLFVTMLKDESTYVQGMAISRVPHIMASMFGIAGDDDVKASVLDAAIKSVIQFHSILPANRNREQTAFVETLESFLLFCSPLQMYEMVIPILLDLIEDAARPVQLLAMRVLVKCIRKNDVSSHRYSLLSKIRNEYGHAKSYWRRILYLDACVFALVVNSRQYCRLNYLDIAIDLLEDPIPNVRVKAATLVPQWRDVLTHLSDDKMLERIRHFLDDAASSDSDRDVVGAVLDAKAAIEASDLVQRRPHEDADDKRRVSEEENLGLVTDHEDSSADSKWSSMLEYTLVVGKDGQVVRRARVKSLDLVNKLTRTQGKESGRGGGSSLMSAIGMASIGSSALTIGSSMATKADPSRGKTVPKTPSKPGPPLTTLPNCAPVRPANVKMPQTIKVMGSVGKLTTAGGPSSNKTTAAAIRSGTGLSKDAGVMTKIPIIRPTAPAKRETSPSTNTKPSSGSSSGGRMADVSSSSSRLGSIESMGANMKPKATAPTTARR